MVGALYADNPNIDDLIPLIKSTKAIVGCVFSLSSVGFGSG
jgi:hypothetical protein